MKEQVIAFVGNPNVGKSAWINALAGSDFKIGNWAGVTVAKKEALITWEGVRYHLIDLPGCYALSQLQNEEGITRYFLLHEHVDLIINVVDTTNLARNLYLTLCLRELQIPMIVLCNFMDEVHRYRITIDLEALSEQLQVSIYSGSVFDRTTYQALRQGICIHCGKEVSYAPLLPQPLLAAYQHIFAYMKQHIPLGYDCRDSILHRYTSGFLNEDTAIMQQLSAWYFDLDYLADFRFHDEHHISYYQSIDELMKHVSNNHNQRFSFTRKIDHILLHRYFGLPCLCFIFGFFMMVVFRGSAPFNDFIDFLVHDMLMKYANALFVFLPDSARQLLLNGVIAGVGGVLVFIPLMSFLYAMLSVLEESGYMARIAFLMDRFMHLFHLSGKSFVSLLLGFGCNVPAIMATRTLDNEKQKRLTAILIPFMSCGARLPVYMMFAAAFFERRFAVVILCIYGIGIFMALLVAMLLSHVQSFQDDELFILELPPYRKPSFSLIAHKVVLEVKAYIYKAMHVVLWAMVILWSVSYFPNGHIQTSYIAQASQHIAFLYEPLGFGNRWESIAALPGSVIAKETVVGFLDQVLLHREIDEIEAIAPLKDLKQIAYQGGITLKNFTLSFLPQPYERKQDASLVQAIASLWQGKDANLRAFSYMVYILLSIPCIMSIQALWREYGWKLAVQSIALMMTVPYVVSLCIFQFFRLFL